MTKRNVVVACMTVSLLIAAGGCCQKYQAELAELKGQLVETQTKLTDATKTYGQTVDELEAQLATVTAARKAAAKQVEELKPQLAAARTEAETTKTAADKARVESEKAAKQADGMIVTVTGERDAALARAKTAESRAQAAEVRALVAEKDLKALKATYALAKARLDKIDAAAAIAAAKKPVYPIVVIETSLGTIKAELWSDKAPDTVKNFLRYVEEKHYDNLIFHRVIKDFMIQGGGFDAEMKLKAVHEPIKNEATADKKNVRGTLAMARTNVVDSATAQFFINLKDNAFLDHRNEVAQGFGYCAFGKVIEGIDVVDKIGAVATGRSGRFNDVPTTAVLIKSITRAKAAAKPGGNE